MDHARHSRPGHGQLMSQRAYQPSNIVDIPDHDPDNNAVGAAIDKLEEILISVHQALMNNQVLTIPFKTRPEPRRNPAPAARSRSAHSVLQFPGNQKESVKFTRVLRILHLSYCALVSGKPLTKRNIYYQCPDLFKTQAIVDELVDDIAYSLGLGRDGLNIVATAKGLVAGPIVLRLRDSSRIRAGSSDTGIIIPMTKSISQIDFRHTEWVLVVEKDGKGNPDLQTKQFLHLLHAAKPELPMFGLMDYDPYGIRIMRSYSHGTRGHAHEAGVTVPTIQWLGIKSGDLMRTQLHGVVDDDAADGAPDLDREQHAGADGPRPPRRNFESIDPLKARDRTVARSLLKEIPDDFDNYNLECQRELQIMLFLNVKAEIQAVDDAGDISNWLDARMRSR